MWPVCKGGLRGIEFIADLQQFAVHLQRVCREFTIHSRCNSGQFAIIFIAVRACCMRLLAIISSKIAVKTTKKPLESGFCF
jgi:hypothetical protein